MAAARSQRAFPPHLTPLVRGEPIRSLSTRHDGLAYAEASHAHLFRHGYAFNFLTCGGRLDALPEQLGHRDINTTRINLRLSTEDVMREVAKIQF